MHESGRPLKRFSQNFLTNPQIQDKIVQALDIKPSDHILEIGPGKGALSKLIIQKNPTQFKAVEIDPRWVRLLQEEYPQSLEIINRDFLELNPETLFNTCSGKYKVIGNLPYHITSPILFHLIDHSLVFESAVLMVQKEVARRISATPSNKEYGILSVICQTYAQVEYLFEVKAGNFFPVPAVDSAVLRLSFYDALEGINNIELFRKIVRTTFNTRRKMLRNSLCRTFDKSAVYSVNSVNLNRRPEELTIQEFKKLVNELDSFLSRTYDEH